MTKNNKTVAVHTNVQELAKLKNKISKKWQSKLLSKVEKLLRKVTKLPVSINVSKNNIMVNASVIFWYQDHDCKKFIMLKSNFGGEDYPTLQFPYIACLNNDSSSNLLKETVIDMFGLAFSKTLSADTFAQDKVAAVPTVVVNDEDDITQFVSHNIVWAVQITPEQAELIHDKAGNVEVVRISEYQLNDQEVHEIHRFLYQSCVRHINVHKFTRNFIPEMNDEFANSKNKILH